MDFKLLSYLVYIPQISDLNLFVDHYFIPKEAAIILITASIFNFYPQSVKSSKVNFVYISSLILCFVTLV